MDPTTTLIGDVTVPNPDFRFVYDVRLSQYPADPDNLALAKAYQWTNQQIGADEQPSVQVLETLCNAYEYAGSNQSSGTPGTEKSGIDPRRLLLATYGHGKSHLALCLANFFGQPADSSEVEAVLSGVQHVAPGIALRLRSFKAERRPYLVLRLSGSDDSLSAMVVRAVETALGEHPTTAQAELGLWFDKALAVLDKFTPAETETANAYLDQHAPAGANLDLGALRASLRSEQRDGSYRILTHQLVEHVRGVYPNFGAALTPRELLNYVGNEFCGPGKEFAGLLVLFDEFAAFVETYARHYGVHHDTQPLQSLLDGISDLQLPIPGQGTAKRNRAVFVAFAQQDPDDVAELAMQGQSKATLGDLKKELTRLPREARKPLYSPMEAVLDAYLKQSKPVWDALTPDDSVADGDVVDAVDAVRSYFPLRYTDAAGWTLDRIQVTLAYGCHPLHPLTTALLCSATLRAGSAARTVLSFVSDTMETVRPQAALADDGRLCWVRPIALVRYYQHQLVADDAWQQYQATLRKAGPAQIPDTEAVLQAMLLYDTAGFKPGDTEATDYFGAVAVLTGLKRPTVRRTLADLENAGYIEHDAVSAVYRFWANNQDGSQVRTTVAEGLEQLRRSEAQTTAAILAGLRAYDAQFNKLGEVKFYEMENDWDSRVVFLPPSQWSAEYLTTQLKTQVLEAGGRLTDAARGYIIAPLATTDGDVQWFRERAEIDLNKAVEDFTDRQQAPPVVVVLPRKPHEALLNSLLELHVLDHLTPAQERSLGSEPIAQRRATVRTNLQNAVNAYCEELRRAADYVVPAAHRSGVEKGLAGKIAARSTINLGHILSAAYETVYYRFAPRLSDSTRKPTLRTAVGLAADRLYKGNFLDWETATSRGNLGRARELFQKVLKQGHPASWGVVDNSLRVVAPKLPVVRLAFEVLDAAVPPGAVRQPLRPVLLTLLNAPYGYDPWALGLLLGAWYGLNRHQFEATTSQGKPLDYKTWLGTDNNFSVVLENIFSKYDVHLTRRDEIVIEGEVEEMLAKLRYHEPMPLAEAEVALEKLNEFAGLDSNNPRLRDEAKQAASELTYAVNQATAYEKRLTEAEASLDSLAVSLTGIQEIIKLCQLFSNPTKAGFPLGQVRPPSQANLAQLQKRTGFKLRPMLTEVCSGLAHISSLRGYDLAKQSLARLLVLVAPLSEPDLDLRIKDAQQALEERNEEFSKEGLDSHIREKVTEARRASSLVDLRELLGYFQAADPKADSTVSLVAEATVALNTKRQAAEEWLQEMTARAATLTEPAAITAFTRDLDRKATQFESTPEADQLRELERQAARVDKLLANLKDQRREKPKTADELRKVLREYDRLAARDHLAEAQLFLVARERQEFEQRFAEQRTAAQHKLNDLWARNEAKQAPAPILAELERQLDFLADEDKPKRDTLEKELRRRVAKDKASVAEKAFIDIGNRAEQQALLIRLQEMLS